MSAKANSARSDGAETQSNGVHLDTMEPITHSYDVVGHTVLAECCVCCTNSSRRLLTRDYDIQDDFKQSLVDGNEDYIPAAIYRDCEECRKETTHFVC